MQRRSLALAGLAWPLAPLAQSVEKPRLTVAVGGRSLMSVLPLTVADSLGYFRAEGLELTIVDFAGGSQARKAGLDGSADIVCAYFAHTLKAQAAGHRVQAFVLQGRASQVVLGVNTRTLPAYRSLVDLKGRRIGVTALDASTHGIARFVLAHAGLQDSEVRFIGVGAGNGAISALRTGAVDALSSIDPVITRLQRSGDLRVVVDTRIAAVSDQVFGGPSPSGCLFAREEFVQRNPRTVQALTNAVVRACRWIRQAGPSDVVKVVPESYLMGDAAVYLDAFLANRDALSPDGLFPAGVAETVLRTLHEESAVYRGLNWDLRALSTNEFVLRAHAQLGKG